MISIATVNIVVVVVVVIVGAVSSRKVSPTKLYGRSIEFDGRMKFAGMICVAAAAAAAVDCHAMAILGWIALVNSRNVNAVVVA